MGLQRFPFGDFRGGLNTKTNPADLQPNEAQSLLNVILTARGAMEQRFGKTRFDSSGFPATKRLEYAKPWYFGSTRLLLGTIDGSIYSSTTGGAFTERFNGTDGTLWAIETAVDSTNSARAWFVNGVDNPKKWDGSAGSVSDWANSPPNGTCLLMWKNRMIVAGVAATPQRVFFSDVGNPESPASQYGTNWIDFRAGEDDFDPVVDLALLGDQLVVLKKSSVWVVYDPVTFSNRRVGAPGPNARFQTDELMGRLYFVNQDGIWSTNGVNAPRLESNDIQDQFYDVVNFSVIDKARVCCTREGRVFVAIATGGSSVNNRIFEQFLGMAEQVGKIKAPWLIHDYPCSSLVVFRPVAANVLLAGDSGAAKVHQLFNGTNDDGVAIAAHWQGGWRSLIAEEPFERIRRLNVEMEGRLQLDLMQDFGTTPKFTAVLETTVDADQLWDGGNWEPGIWDPVASTRLMRARPEARGRYHSVRISNNVLNKRFVVLGGEFSLRGGKEHT